ncbi:DUF4352 domain-containing protein [Staphylococcus equorum]|uniref:DUF4352 domain-containing protein n=1 Tax=Staphylococcus equorum TaxID=246432 RepID=UPI001ED8D751|nr:DUF4352 domain-containing protein [Staphylococcus equorum]
MFIITIVFLSKKKKVKGVLISTIVVFVLGLASLIGAIGTTASYGEDNNDSGTKMPDESSKSESNNSDESEEKSSSSSDEMKQKGDTVEIDGVEFTLQGSEYINDRNEFSDVQADKVLKVNVKIKNNSDSEIPVGGDLKVYADGEEVDTYPATDIQDTLLGSVSPDRSTSGSEAYAINGNPEELELEFKPSMSFSDKRYVYELNPE